MQWVVCTFIPSTDLHIHTLTCSLEVTAQKTISVKPWMGNMRKQIPPITLLSFTNARHLCFLDTIELLLLHMHQNLQQQKVKTHHEQNRLMWNHKFLNWQMINVIWCVQGLNIRHMMFNGGLNTKCEMSNSAKPNMFFTMEYLHSSVFRRQTPVSTYTQFKHQAYDLRQCAYGSNTRRVMYSLGMRGSWCENTVWRPISQVYTCLEGLLLRELLITTNLILPLSSSILAASSRAAWAGNSDDWKGTDVMFKMGSCFSQVHIQPYRCNV